MLQTLGPAPGIATAKAHRIEISRSDFAWQVRAATSLPGPTRIPMTTLQLFAGMSRFTRIASKCLQQRQATERQEDGNNHRIEYRPMQAIKIDVYDSSMPVMKRQFRPMLQSLLDCNAAHVEHGDAVSSAA